MQYITENIEAARQLASTSRADKRIRALQILTRRDVFQAAKEIVKEALVLVHSGWTQGSGAKNAESVKVSCDSPDACQFCAWGALQTAHYRQRKEVSGLASEWVEQILLALIGAPDKTGFLDHGDRDLGALFAWNDTEGRSQYEIECILRHASLMCDVELECCGPIRSAAFVDEAMNHNVCETDLTALTFDSQLSVRADALTVIEKAIAQITPDGCWIIGHSAKDKDGNKIGYDKPEACAWCAAGSIWLAYDKILDLKDENMVPATWVLQALCATVSAREAPVDSYELSTIFSWNDTPGRTQEEVLKAMNIVLDIAKWKHSEARLLAGAPYCPGC